MRALVLVLTAALLAGCASPNGEGQAMSGVVGVPTDAAKVGDNQWLITCQQAVSACTWRAQQVCPNGFDVKNSGQSQGSSGYANAYGAGYGTITTYNLAVACKG